MKIIESFARNTQSGLFLTSLKRHLLDGVLDLPEQLRRYPVGLKIENCRSIKSLGNLLSINGALEIYNCPNLEDLGDLKTVAGGIEVLNCPKLEDVSNLQSVRGRYIFRNTPQSQVPPNLTIEKLAGLPNFVVLK